MSSRRSVLAAGLALAGAAAFPGFARARDADKAGSGKPLNILVLGGTGFLGPHFVEAALKRGHKLTLFDRGKTNPTRFAGSEYRDIEQLHGDRNSDMHALEGDRRWDAVLDTSAYLPADVERSTRLPGARIDRYLIVSTISVYAKLDMPGLDEDAPLAKLADPDVTEVTGETYGGLKALCEQAAERGMPGRVIVVRPGLIVGPGDNSDRFSYWPARADRGGEILAPGSAADPTQFIDVRDLAGFLLRAIEQRNIGIYNADAPAGKLTMGALLSACQRAAGKPSTLACVRLPSSSRHRASARGRTCRRGFPPPARAPASAVSARRVRGPSA